MYEDKLEHRLYERQILTKNITSGLRCLILGTSSVVNNISINLKTILLGYFTFDILQVSGLLLLGKNCDISQKLQGCVLNMHDAKKRKEKRISWLTKM